MGSIVTGCDGVCGGYATLSENVPFQTHSKKLKFFPYHKPYHVVIHIYRTSIPVFQKVKQSDREYRNTDNTDKIKSFRNCNIVYFLGKV